MKIYTRKNIITLLLLLSVLSLFFRIWLAVNLPITVDESYFYWWGVKPDWGYYDHPPMIGWLNAVMLQFFGDNALALRLPAIFLPLIIGGIIWWSFYPIDRIRASWAVYLFWLTPLNWISCVITTDTPLIFWSMLSMGLLIRAEYQSEFNIHTCLLLIMSGFSLGCAFLSKYFAVVIYLSYLVYFLLFRPRRWYFLIIVFATSLPGPILNLWWNMNNGWPNIMFNLYTRNKDESFSWIKPLLYLLDWVYLLTPGVVVLLFFEFKKFSFNNKNILLKVLVFFPIFFFLCLCSIKVIGLHWVLNFYPLCFTLVAFSLSTDKLKLCAKWIFFFSLIHLVVIFGISLTNISFWKDFKQYPQLVFFFKTKELISKMNSPSTILMATSYAPASIYGYTLKKYVPVFGVGTFHSRQDDLVVDFSKFSGKDIRIITFEKPDLNDYKAYFLEVKTYEIEESGIKVYAVDGKFFNYQIYKDLILDNINLTFHQVPFWLLSIENFFE
jgi:4-amino-4-deoxy-L-arabinose transferase-like glycosyltransferase